MTEPYTAPGSWNGDGGGNGAQYPAQAGQPGLPGQGAVPPQYPYAAGAPGAPGMPGMPGMPQPAAGPPGPPAPKWHRKPAVRAFARWTAALLICAGAGTGTAMGITAADRTDVPGLATTGDGRWEYPRLEHPALPAGKPRPFSDGNSGEVHYADTRELVLPAPEGATEDKELTGDWVSTDRYLEEYVKDDRASLRTALSDLAVRHVAARGWTMPDGTSVRVYLLQFSSTAYTDHFLDEDLDASVPGAEIEGAGETEMDEDFPVPGSDNAGTDHKGRFEVHRERKPYGDTQVRQAYLASGDIAGLVVAEKKGGVDDVPFAQTVILQSRLLE